MLFTAEGEPVAERKTASLHVEGPPYRHIDPEPMVAICRGALPKISMTRWPQAAFLRCEANCPGFGPGRLTLAG